MSIHQVEVRFPGPPGKPGAGIDEAMAALDVEAAARIAADSGLATDIADEAAARTAADSTIATSVTDEATARSAADAALSTALDDEVASRTSGDSTNAGAIAAEATARENADTALAGDIGAEATARGTAVLDVQAAVDAEEAARIAGDALSVKKGDLVVNAADYDSLADAFAVAGASRVFIPAGTHSISAAIEVPAGIGQIELAAGAVVSHTANANIFTRTGTWGPTENIGTTITQGGRSAVVADGTAYAVGEWVLIHGGNIIPNGADKFGYLRCITGIAGNTLTFDTTTPRTISTTPRVTKVSLANPLAIVGQGILTYATPADNTTEAVHFCFAERPVFTATVSGGGDDGVRFSHCVGGKFDGHCEDLLDDNVTHFGYGVNISGATRGLEVRGSATRVRHAVTTIAGPNLTNLGPVGEPENCLIAIHAYNCTNKGIDTHRPGWGLIIEPNVQGCPSGGVQIRSDATVLRPGVISGCSGAGINIDAGLSVGPVITSPTILWQRTAGPAILCQSDAIITDPYIRGFVGTAIETTAGVAARVRGGEIDGLGGAGTTGVVLAGTGSRITGLRVKSVTTGIDETGTGADNDWSDVEFVDCLTDQTRVPTYTQRRLALQGDVGTAGPTAPNGWRAPAAVSLATGAHGGIGVLTFVPIEIPPDKDLTALAIEITTAAGAGSGLRIGLYHSNADGLPGALFAEAGVADGASTGVKEVSFGATQRSKGGTYWGAALGEGGNPSARKQQALSSYGTSATDVLANMRGSFYATGISTGSLPATAPTLIPTGTATRVAVKLGA